VSGSEPVSAVGDGPIGIYDSGVGGLSVLRYVRALLPHEDLLYVADQAHVPYGPRPAHEVRRFAAGVVRFFESERAKLVVVACNTASAAALGHLRATFPGVPFVGMEPAVKPAAATTISGTVGVLATPATLQGALFESVVERFARDVVVLEATLPGLVERIEAGDLDGPETRRIVEQDVRTLVERGADTIVLACTHYPFVVPLIEDAAGPGVHVIDPSPAVARQVARLLDEHRLRRPAAARGAVELVTTGSPDVLRDVAERLVGRTGRVVGAEWDEVSGDLARHGRG
jgi:glutamate racemase